MKQSLRIVLASVVTVLGLALLPSAFIAHAQDINQSSPRVRQLADSMKARFAAVQSIKGTGAVGENNRGFLELIKPDAIDDPEERNKVQTVIAEENADRKSLYQEIARINRDQNLSIGTVESIYAVERIERARSGDWVQLPTAGQHFDKLKGSSLARSLGDAFKPGEWVQVP
jgi:uncharacterized protein YdbL (DUF1318 family)